METLKFLMITTHYPPMHIGGDAVYVEYLSRELQRKGHEVHVAHNPAVFSMLKGSSVVPSKNASDDVVFRHPYRLGGGGPEILLSLLFGVNKKAIEWLLGLSKKLKPDVVHWHNTKGFVAQPLSISNSVSLLTAHDYYLICPRSSLLRHRYKPCQRPRLCTLCCIQWRTPPQLWRAGRRRVLRLSKDMGLIAPSLFMKARLERDGLRVHHILRNFVPDPSRPVATASECSDSLVYIGVLEPHKGIMTLVEAFCKSSDLHGFGLDIIGDGSLRPEIERIISSKRLAYRVRIHGFLERKEAERIRRRATAQIVPSEWYENSPLTVIEALALGVPVIGADAGGTKEIVGPDSGGETFPSGDVESLRCAITSLWASRENTDHRRKLARKSYQLRFSPDVHISQYFRIINETTIGNLGRTRN